MNYLYPPFEDGSSGEADDDLIPLPAAVTRIRRAVRAYGTALPVMLAGHRQRGDSQIDPGEAAPFGADPAAAGALDESAVGLIGPGAAAAARARLVAALAATGTSREAGVVVLPATTLQRLLPSWTPSGGGGHLEIGADLNDALARFEHHLRRRRTRLEPPQTPEVSSSQGAASGDPAARTAPGLLLITDLAPPAAHERLTQALRTAAGRGAGVVVLGELPGGGLTLTVERDGLTRARRPSNHPSRLAVLDEASTVAILQVLAEAHPAPVPTRDQETTAPPRPGSPPARSSLPASESPAAPAGTGPRVSIRVLGSPPVILDHEGLPVAGLRRHAAELLVYLAVHRTGAPLAQILEAVYPDATWKRAQQRLSTEAANLRRSIRTAAGAPDLQPVVNTGSRYHLDPAVLDIDLWQLVDQLDQLESATTDRAQPAHHLQAILAAADGALPGAEGGYDWIDAPREHLRRRIIRALLALADDPATTAPEAGGRAAPAARPAGARHPGPGRPGRRPGLCQRARRPARHRRAGRSGQRDGDRRADATVAPGPAGDRRTALGRDAAPGRRPDVWPTGHGLMTTIKRQPDPAGAFPRHIDTVACHVKSRMN
jgi:hypothetical protein